MFKLNISFQNNYHPKVVQFSLKMCHPRFFNNIISLNNVVIVGTVATNIKLFQIYKKTVSLDCRNKFANRYKIATYLDVRSLDLDVDPVVRAEGDGQQGCGDDRRDGRERQGDR